MTDTLTLPARVPLPDHRPGVTHHLTIQHADGELDLYLICNTYPDGRLGEVFVKAAKAGSRVHAYLDLLMLTLSVAIQSGVPLATLTSKYRGTRFPPEGRVNNYPEEMVRAEQATLNTARPYILVSSPVDAIARYLDWMFPDGKERGR